MSTLHSLTFARFVFSFLFLCIPLTSAQSDSRCLDAIDTCDPATDQFQGNRFKIEYANTTITELKYSNTFVDLTVKWREDSFTYRFVVCGCDSPQTDDGRTIIFINPDSFYIDDSPILALFATLARDKIGLIKAVPSRSFIFTQEIRSQIKSGTIKEVNDGDSVDYDAVEREDPALSIIGGFSIDAYVDAAIDVPFLVIAETEEPNPLARAEWMKILGLVLGRTAEAVEMFQDVVDKYNDARDKAAKAVRQPSVFLGYPFAIDPESDNVNQKYAWSQTAGDSYIADLLRDANAAYRYNSKKPDPDATSISLTISEVIRDFGSAKVLLNSGRNPGDSGRNLQTYLNELVNGPDDPDPAFRKEVEKLRAVRCANVWSNQKRVTADGMAFDYFSSAVFEPDELLLDFVQALHPNLDLAGRETKYIYRYEATDDLTKNCPYQELGEDAPDGKVHVDKKYVIPELSRFAVEDKFDATVPEVKKAFEGRMEMYFHEEDLSEDETVLTLRGEVDESEEDEFKNSTKILAAMQRTLGSGVRERRGEDVVNVDGGGEGDAEEDGEDDAEEDGEDGGLSGGGIAGIVIAVLVVVVAVLFCVMRRRKSKLTQHNALPQDHYWEGGQAGDAGGAYQSNLDGTAV